MATVRRVKPGKSFNFHTLCNIYDGHLDTASGNVRTYALMEHESGILGTRRRREMESILKELACRYSADCYRLLNAGVAP
ncbi:hypothetical protein BURCENBC7_AP7470 [Burkholderia cenocepacia BC7]|jgi:hypothetical protein|nr:hypothetical protein BURCENK562V_C0882 [Burkholderia cenocepacia K56-2Valvano]ERI30291.1 hypothetical protein BURCENBC7_AP7470 [Burkholderia cenocepacia BC7]